MKAEGLLGAPLSLFRRGSIAEAGLGRVDAKPETGKGESLEEILATYECIPKEEVEGAAAFIEKCLQVDPSKRATVQELLSDPWLEV